MNQKENRSVEGLLLSPIWFQAVLDNTIKTLDPWYASSGFRTNPARFRSTAFDGGPRLGDTFLLNTRLQRQDRETTASVLHYMSDEATALLSLNGLETNPALGIVDLPRNTELSMRLSKCFAKRRSRRIFTGDPIPLSALATLCRMAAGITGRARANLHREGEEAVDLHFRSAPSPGGLYGVDLYLLVQHVRGVRPGLYLYHSRSDKLL